MSLAGQVADLADLPLWFSGQRVTVIRVGERFVVDMPVTVVGDDYATVRAKAEEFLTVANAVGRMIGQGFRPVALAGGLTGLDESGQVVHQVLLAKGAEARAKAGTGRLIVGGVSTPDPRTSAAEPFLRASERSPLARDALAILSRPNLTWSELYILFEIVQSAVGNAMFQRGWIAERDADRFTGTANNYKILGIQGRHGPKNRLVPKEVMELHEAERAITTLAKHWLEHVAAETTSEGGGGNAAVKWPPVV